MLRIRYTYVRSILAVFVLASLAAAVTIAQNTAAVVALLVLCVASCLSWINPPGIFGWLLQAACPHCPGRVVWEIEQLPEPYHEVITVRCQGCGRSKIDFAFHPN
jgi:hypothetical protein